MQPLLSVRLDVDFAAKPGVLRDLRFQIRPGEILGFAGQSGSGKSTLALSILRLLDARTSRTRGEIVFRGQDLLQLPERQMRAIRGRGIGLALQAASSALNPHLRIETQMKEAWKAHEKRCWKIGEQRVLEMLDAMNLRCDGAFLRRYPREVSIGQAQRIVIAMALLHRPSLLIADEPTSALDLLSQLELLRLLKKLNEQSGVAMLYISHDLGTVRYLCHRVCLLNDGRIVESGPAESVFDRPESEFANSLAAAYSTINGNALVDRTAAVDPELSRT